ncbi:MAG: DUF4258 domain-containing protein [bacterium]
MKPTIKFSFHALEKLIEREISPAEVSEALSRSEVIESYPDDFPLPSKLLLGFAGMRPLHMVVADNTPCNSVIIVTAYEPDPLLWKDGFRRRN